MFRLFFRRRSDAGAPSTVSLAARARFQAGNPGEAGVLAACRLYGVGR